MTPPPCLNSKTSYFLGADPSAGVKTISNFPAGTTSSVANYFFFKKKVRKNKSNKWSKRIKNKRKKEKKIENEPLY